MTEGIFESKTKAYAQNNNFDVKKLETKFKEWQDSFYKEIEKYI